MDDLTYTCPARCGARGPYGQPIDHTPQCPLYTPPEPKEEPVYHAHISSSETDCDGQIDRSYISVPNEGQEDYDFEGRVLRSVVSFAPDDASTLEVSQDTTGETRLSWSEPTQEGHRSIEVIFCHDEDCDLGESGQRDHRAEAAGY